MTLTIILRLIDNVFRRPIRYLLPIAIGYQLWLLAAWKRDQELTARRARVGKTA